MAKFAVILAGCGVYDGAEINEAVLTFLALEENNIQYDTFAPNIKQHHVINHYTGSVDTEERNVLVEANRITRGKTKDSETLVPSEYDALIVPGGFGVAKNLSDFAFTEASFSIEPTVEKILTQFKELKKPVGYMCIAPALLCCIYQDCQATIGSDKTTGARLSSLGMLHHEKSVGDIVVDEANRVVTTPAYMLADTPGQAKTGIFNLVKAVHALV
ncbi:MAG: isoprenoid biosynthesis glyoxalase ElbB [Candidatus Marinamargulisbacteria bacterium]